MISNKDYDIFTALQRQVGVLYSKFQLNEQLYKGRNMLIFNCMLGKPATIDGKRCNM